MKKMKAFCTATVLALTLSASVFAGDIASPGCVSTAPPTVSPNETAVVSSGDAGVLSDVLLALLAMF